MQQENLMQHVKCMCFISADNTNQKKTMQNTEQRKMAKKVQPIFQDKTLKWVSKHNANKQI